MIFSATFSPQGPEDAEAVSFFDSYDQLKVPLWVVISEICPVLTEDQA